MSDLTMAWILAVGSLVCSVANAADEPAAFLRKADIYAFEAKQYAAAGKPVTNTIAQRYARLSHYYRQRASEAHSDR
jgi:hypothetical protein